MFSRPRHGPNPAKQIREESGQALMEFALCASVLFIIMFGVIDVSRALFVGQVIVNLTGEGCALASRGTTLSDTATAVMAASSPLDFAGHGRVIVSSVYNNNNVLKLTGQSALGGLAAASRIGSSDRQHGDAARQRHSPGRPNRVHHRGVLHLPLDHAGGKFSQRDDRAVATV